MKKLPLFVLIAILNFGLNAQSLDFEVNHLNGDKTILSKHLSKDGYTIISFWATWCKPCIEELNVFNDLYEDWQAEYGTEILAVSQDNVRSVDQLKSFVRVRDWQFPILSDVNGNAQRQFSFSRIPYLIILDKNKKIVYRSTGYVAGSEDKIETLISKK